MSNRFAVHFLRGCFYLLVLLFAVALLPTYRSAATERKLKPTLILISLDGFRWDYLEKAPTSALKELAARGVRAKRMIPVFPSETWPNHYSIATGLYPDAHGIVKNSFYDTTFKESFATRGVQAAEGRWYGAEPIWVTAEKQGQIAASYFWPGSEAVIDGKRSTYWNHNDGKMPNSDRIKGILSWLDLPDDKRPTFISLYIPDLDGAGHNFGPDSPEVARALTAVDAAIGELITGLKERNLFDQINIMVVSDHGMTPADRKHVVYVEDYVDLSKLETDRQYLGTNSHVWTIAGKEEEVYRALSKAPHLAVYRKKDVPTRFHHSNNPRIAPIVCISEEGWTLALKRGGPSESAQTEGIGGSHGYDPKLPTMGALFIASGPAFKQGTVVESFENIQLYNVMAYILKLKPAPNAGNLALMKNMLR